jgi:protein-tyrosine phosphatase
MIDIHTHVLPGIDDGSQSLEESLLILEDLASHGFTDVICTPHYIADSQYAASNVVKTSKINTLQAAANNKSINIKLHLGNEAYITEDMGKLIRQQQIHTCTNTNYLLFELPMSGAVNNLQDYCHNLRCEGYNLILAHPERYITIQKNPQIAVELHKKGVEFQSNYGSMSGKYGKHAMKTLKFLLKNDLVDYFGTDIHHSDSEILEKFDKSVKKIVKIIGQEKYTSICQNAEHLIK